PVLLTARASDKLKKFTAKTTTRKPDINFTAKDGIVHSSWVISDADDIQFIEKEFAQVPALYIADGHHRSAAAARVFQSRQGAGESGYLLSVIYPDNQVRILPYNRVLKDLNGLSPTQLLEKLDGVFVTQPAGKAAPERKHQL